MPGRIGLERIISAVETRIGIAFGADVTLPGDAVAGAGQRDLVGEGSDRLPDAEAIDPGSRSKLWQLHVTSGA